MTGDGPQRVDDGDLSKRVIGVAVTPPLRRRQCEVLVAEGIRQADCLPPVDAGGPLLTHQLSQGAGRLV